MRMYAPLAAFAATATLAAAAPGNATWKSIRIGGGGYVTGTFFHDIDPVMYFKTDVGGAYSRALTSARPEGVEWIPMLDSQTPEQAEFYSVSHLALDASNGNTVYALLGEYLTWSPCRVSKSTDGGQTWSVLVDSKNWTLQCWGNGDDRGVGDRLAIHPIDNSTLMVAGYDGRVYVTRDGFASSVAGVHNLSLPGVSYPTSHPVRSLTFMPTALGAATYNAIAAIPGLGFWWSPGPAYEDPSTWSFIAGTDALGNTSRLLVDAVEGPYLYVSTEGGFARLSLTSGAAGLHVDWFQQPDNHTYDGLAVNPANHSDITFVSIGDDSSTTFRRSLDGGATWFVVNWTTVTTVPWAGDNSYDLKLNAASSFKYDPHAQALFNLSSQVWATDFFGLWKCSDWDLPAQVARSGGDPSGVQVTFTSNEWGHEEVCMNFVKGPPNGLVLSGAADDFGWLHDNGLDDYPTRVFPSNDAHNCGFGADYTLSTVTAPGGGVIQSAIWVTAGDEYGACRNNWCGTHHWVGVSYDGGKTFNETTYDAVISGSNSYPYRVVVHPFNGSVAVITGYQGMPVVYTHDAGSTWGNATQANGTNAGQMLESVGPYGNFWWAQPLVRDNNADAVGSPSTPATLYYYNGTSSLFTSVDNGVTWSNTYNGFPTWTVPIFAIATPPRGTAAAGDIWAFAGWQLHHSTNGGYNWSSAWQFYSVKNTIAVGPLPNGTSAKTDKSAAELSAICASKLPVDRQPKPATSTLLQSDIAAGRQYAYPASTATSAAYAVYAVGQLSYNDAQYGVYGSVDYGNTWVALTTATQGLGDDPNVVEASLQSPGTIFVGTEGRGAFYSDVSAVLMEALEACAV